MNDPAPLADSSGNDSPETHRRISPSELMEMSLMALPELHHSREQLLGLSETRSGMRPRDLHELIRRSVVGG